MVYTKNVENAIFTEWKEAIPENDYIVKIMVKYLQTDTKYFYRLQYSRDKSEYRTGQLCEFPGRAVRCLPAPPQTRTSRFPAYGSS